MPVPASYLPAAFLFAIRPVTVSVPAGLSFVLLSWKRCLSVLRHPSLFGFLFPFPGLPAGGSGTGNGTGSGRGTGSGGGTHDYVSVPNKLGNDSSITKDKGDSTNSDYYKAKNGLAWKGEHVDLDSVVGDYTKEAYEGIANGKYPAGMEDVIRNYFENLN